MQGVLMIEHLIYEETKGLIDVIHEELLTLYLVYIMQAGAPPRPRARAGRAHGRRRAPPRLAGQADGRSPPRGRRPVRARAPPHGGKRARSLRFGTR